VPTNSLPRKYLRRKAFQASALASARESIRHAVENNLSRNMDEIIFL
jgi:hypothetical protein